MIRISYNEWKKAGVANVLRFLSFYGVEVQRRIDEGEKEYVERVIRKAQRVEARISRGTDPKG